VKGDKIFIILSPFFIGEKNNLRKNKKDCKLDI